MFRGTDEVSDHTHAHALAMGQQMAPDEDEAESIAKNLAGLDQHQIARSLAASMESAK